MSLEVGRTYSAPIEEKLNASKFEMCAFTVVSVPGEPFQGGASTSLKAISDEPTQPADGDDRENCQ